MPKSKKDIYQPIYFIPMVDAKKVVIGLIIAILFAVLVFSIIEAAYPRPEYNDFCKDSYASRPLKSPSTIIEVNCTDLNVPGEFHEDCVNREGFVDYKYDSNGCATEAFCNTCSKEYDDARDEHDRYVFYISALLSLIAIFIALYMPFRKEPPKKGSERSELDEWIATGFLLGGAFALFFGTATSYSALDRITRPIVIFLEIILVIFISYKKFGKK
jgi:hypothetical protein